MKIKTSRYKVRKLIVLKMEPVIISADLMLLFLSLLIYHIF